MFNPLDLIIGPALRPPLEVRESDVSHGRDPRSPLAGTTGLVAAAATIALAVWAAQAIGRRSGGS